MDITHKIQTYENMQLIKGIISDLKIKMHSSILDSKEGIINRQLGDFYSLFQEFMAENNYTAENIDKALDAFITELDKMQIVDLELAFIPKPAFVTKLVKWVNTNIQANTLLNITYDRSLIGGALITYKGKFFNSSSLRRINDFFNKTPEFDI